METATAAIARLQTISPLGKVPLLRVGQAVIFEAAMVLEYLEETQVRGSAA